MVVTTKGNAVLTKAKLIPTAKASMLVAIANTNKVPLSRGLNFFCSSSSPCNPSLIIFPPHQANKLKATQWSILSIQ